MGCAKCDAGLMFDFVGKSNRGQMGDFVGDANLLVLSASRSHVVTPYVLYSKIPKKIHFRGKGPIVQQNTNTYIIKN